MSNRQRLSRTVLRSRLFRRYLLSYLLAVLVPVFAAILLITTIFISEVEDLNERAHESLLQDMARHMDERFARMVDAAMSIATQEPIRRLAFGEIIISPRNDPELNFQILRSRTSLAEQLAALQRSVPFVRSVHVYFELTDSVVTTEGAYSASEFFGRVHRINAEGSKPDWVRRFPASPLNLGPVYYAERYDAVGNKVESRYRAVPVSVPYPLNAQGRALLVLSIDVSILEQLIHVSGSYPIATEIVTHSGTVIAASGRSESFPTAGGDGVRRRQQPSADGLFIYVAEAQTADIHAAARRLRVPLWIFAAVAVVVGVSLSYRLSVRFYSPVAGLQRVFKRVGGSSGVGEEGTESSGELELIRHWTEIILEERQTSRRQINALYPLVADDVFRRAAEGLALNDHETDVICSRILPASILAVRLDPIGSDELPDRRAFRGIENVAAMYIVDAGSFVVAYKGEADRFLSAVKTRAVGFRTTVGVGSLAVRASDLSVACTSASAAAAARTLSSDHALLAFEMSEGAHHGEQFLTDQEATRIANLVRVIDTGQLNEAIERIIEGLSIADPPEVDAKTLARDLLGTVVRVARAPEESSLPLERYARWSDELERIRSYDELLRFFKSVVTELLHPCTSPTEHERAIERAVRYIRQHYSEPLSVTFFAELLGMSPGHFSRTFKAVTGSRYIDVVNTVRIGHAKELLLGSRLRIDEVSSRVGYLGTNSFSAIFKKYQGVTPGQFRSTGGMQ